MIYIESGAALSSRAFHFLKTHLEVSRTTELAKKLIRHHEQLEQKFLFPRRAWNPLERLLWISKELPESSYNDCLKFYTTFKEFDQFRLFAFDIKEVLLNAEHIPSETQQALLLYYKETLFLDSNQFFIRNRGQELFFASTLVPKSDTFSFADSEFLITPTSPIEDWVFYQAIQNIIQTPPITLKHFRSLLPNFDSYIWFAPETPMPVSQWGPFHTALSPQSYLVDNLEHIRAMRHFVTGSDFSSLRFSSYHKTLQDIGINFQLGHKAQWEDLKTFLSAYHLFHSDISFQARPHFSVENIFDFCLEQNLFSHTTVDLYYLRAGSSGPSLFDKHECVFFRNPTLVGISHLDQLSSSIGVIHSELLSAFEQSSIHKHKLEKPLLTVGYPRSVTQHAIQLSEHWTTEIERLKYEAKYFVLKQSPVQARDNKEISPSPDPKKETKSYTSALSPSSLELYSHCPKKFYFQKIEKLSPSELWDPISIPANKWGALIHKVIEDAHSKDKVEHLTWVELLSQHAPIYFSTHVSSQYLSTLAAHFDSVATRLNIFWNTFERPLKSLLPTAIHSKHEIKIETQYLNNNWVGRIDRVDIHTRPDESQFALIWDYKTGTPPSTKALTQLRSGSFQWFIYKQLFETLNPSIPVLGGGYLQPLRPENSFVFLLDHSRTPPNSHEISLLQSFLDSLGINNEQIAQDKYEELFNETDSALGLLCNSLRQDISFAAAPRKESFCEKCDFNSLCGKTFT